MHLKLYTDRSYLPKSQKYIPLLVPFWGRIKEDDHLDGDRFEEYAQNGKNYFSIVSPQEADAFLLPGEWVPRNDNELAHQLTVLAKKFNKPLIIFFNSDSDENIPIENAIVFRTSFYNSSRKPNEFALPGWSIDFLKAYSGGRIVLREKQKKPVIGYTGYIDYYDVSSFLKHAYRLIKKKGKVHPGARCRGKASRFLSRNHDIETEFIFRPQCLTGSATPAQRSEYVRNIINTDYSLIARGGGNFSYRLYEVLSCGRIPLFINTDCVLPYDQLIDWKKYLVWIEVDKIETIAEAVADFHNSLSEDKFIEMQKNARALYEQCLSPIGFYSNIWHCLPGISRASGRITK